MKLQPGACIRLISHQNGTYQVLNIDDLTDQCWIRRWSLARHGSPAFAVPLHQQSLATETGADQG